MGTAVANRQNLLDWVQLRDYTAPAAIAALADQDSMTPYGRKIFYVNHPAIDSKDSFFNLCPSGGEKTIVLGCYHSDQRGIFLLSVNDPRLDGVTQVTAAHEMLHGAYDRLSGADRQEVDAMLLDYYRHGLKDPRILSTIDAYKQSEPDDVVNEMHSVFGSEVSSLPAPLEQYYKRYFTNRAQVAGFANQYEAEFTSRQTIVQRDDKQLDSLKAQISSAEADLKAMQAQLTSQQSQLIHLRASGNVAAYNAGVPIYNNMIDTYNAEVDSVKALIDQFNQLVNERNAVAFEEDQLINALSQQSVPAKR